ncbi:hypothetical protein ACWEIJ_09785 [Lentzea sp. NPDC004789]
MNSSVKIAFVAAFAAVGIAACTAAPAVRNNAAPQTSSSTPTSETSTPPPSVVTEVVTATVTNPPRPEAVTKTDDRVGYGPIKLGMTLDEARTAGLTDLTWESDGDGLCVGDDKIAVSKKYGVVRISLPRDAKTAKGIGIGSTFGDVKRAYPQAAEYRGGWSAVVGSAIYSFVGTPGSDANKVEFMKLGSTPADCAMFLL